MAPQCELLVPHFEPTRVERTEDGFDVRLFEEQRCGCGPHPTFGVTVHGQRNGAITIRDKKAVFRDLSTACVD